MEAAEVDQVAVAQLEAAELDRQVALVVVADLVDPVGVEPVEDVHQLVQVVQVVQAVVLVDQVAVVEHFVVAVHVFLVQEGLPIIEVGPENILNYYQRFRNNPKFSCPDMIE